MVDRLLIVPLGILAGWMVASVVAALPDLLDRWAVALAAAAADA